MNASINLTYANWTAPPITQLNFSTNCTTVAGWAQTWLSGEPGLNSLSTARFLRQVLPNDLQQVPTDGQLIDWILAVIRLDRQLRREGQVYNDSNPDPFWNVTINAFDACLYEVCRALPWSGVPDITGPGVLTSAWIEAVLATAFALVAVWEWYLHRRQVFPGPKRQRLFDAFNATLDVFVNNAMLLSLCINIAVIVLVAQGDNEDYSQSVLAWQTAIFSCYAFLFPSCVYEITQEQTKKGDTRMFFLIVTSILFIVDGNMLPVFLGKEDTNNSWEIYCYWDIIPRARQVTAIVVTVFGYSFWLWVLVFGLVPWLMKKRFPNLATKLKKGRKFIRPYIAVTLGIVMWSMLLLMTVVRQMLLKRSGYHSEDAKWTFGQVLSLGAWLPVLIELYYLRKDVQSGLAERLPDGWTVIKKGDEGLGQDSTNHASDNAAGQASGEDEETHGLLRTDIQRPGTSRSRISNSSTISLRAVEAGVGQAPRSFTA